MHYRAVSDLYILVYRLADALVMGDVAGNINCVVKIMPSTNMKVNVVIIDARTSRQQFINIFQWLESHDKPFEWKCACSTCR